MHTSKVDIIKLTPQQCEALFQSTDDDLTKYYCIEFCCENVCKKILKGINIGNDKFETRVGEAVLEVWQKIKIRGDKPNKLSSYVYWPCKRALQGDKAMQEDRESVDYDDWSNNGDYIYEFKS